MMLGQRSQFPPRSMMIEQHQCGVCGFRILWAVLISEAKHGGEADICFAIDANSALHFENKAGDFVV